MPTTTKDEAARTPGNTPSAEPVAILYENWRGETAVRHIVPGGDDAESPTLWFGMTEWHRQPQHLLSAWDVEKQAYRDFALSGVKAWGQAAVDAALSALASPAVPDSLRFGEGKLVVDVGTYAERPAVFIKPVEIAGPIGELAADQGDLTRLEPGEQVLTFPTMEQARAVRDVMLGRTTPAQPAGAVPDSLRALAKRWAETIRNSQRQNGKKDWISLHDTEANEITKLLDAIASHPAGQSAGSGAEGWRERAATEIDAIAQQWGTEGDADGRAYAKTLAAILRAEQIAPDSTRTGDEGTEWAWVPRTATNEMTRAADDADSDHDGFGDYYGHLWAAMVDAAPALAARPAAPEAQGAWRPGSKMARTGQCDDCGANYCHCAEDTYKPIAPPTSSGQGKR